MTDFLIAAVIFLVETQSNGNTNGLKASLMLCFS